MQHGSQKDGTEFFTVASAPSPQNNLVFVKEVEFSSVLCIVTLIYVTIADVCNISIQEVKDPIDVVCMYFLLYCVTKMKTQLLHCFMSKVKSNP